MSSFPFFFCNAEFNSIASVLTHLEGEGEENIFFFLFPLQLHCAAALLRKEEDQNPTSCKFVPQVFELLSTIWLNTSLVILQSDCEFWINWLKFVASQEMSQMVHYSYITTYIQFRIYLRDFINKKTIFVDESELITTIWEFKDSD